MAGKEKDLNAYKVATDLAVKMAHAVTASDGVPDPLTYLAIINTIGVMTDLEIGCNTKYRRKKANCYARSTYKLSRLKSVVCIMKETGWLDKNEFKMLKTETENLSKMVWGLLKSLNRDRDEIVEKTKPYKAVKEPKKKVKTTKKK